MGETHTFSHPFAKEKGETPHFFLFSVATAGRESRKIKEKPERMNVMNKRILCVLIAMCLLLSLSACHQTAQPPRETENNATTGNQTTTNHQAPPETTQPQGDGEQEEVRLLTLEKLLRTDYEWAENLDIALVRSEYSCVTLGQEDALKYPNLAEALNQIAAMTEKSMAEEYDNLVVTAGEELKQNSDSFETYTSVMNVQVRRGDSLAVSFLWDSFADYGGIEDYRAFHGSNYDTQTGKALALKDVVREINNDLALAVQEALTGQSLTVELYSDTAVEDYFANTPYDGFNWTLDYTGVTFYFAPGDLCGEGFLTATVPFDRHPELFHEKYTVVPEAYTVELPMNLSFFGETEVGLLPLSISGLYENERNRYLDFDVSTENGNYREECFVSAFHPYYVRTAEGQFLYLFREDFQEGSRYIDLVVLTLGEDGSVAKAGEGNVSPAWLGDNKLIVPTDPGKMLLDDGDSGAQKVLFAVGSDGMPQE